MQFNLKGLTLQNLYPSIISTSTLFVPNRETKKTNTIEFTIYDHDRIGRNEKIGKCFLPLSCIFDGCPVECEDESGNGPPWWLYLSDSQSIVQDFHNLVNIPPTPTPTMKQAEFVNFSDEEIEEIQEMSQSHDIDLTASKYVQVNWGDLWKSYEYKQAMYDQKKKPHYLQLEIQLESQFVENGFLERSRTKPLLIIEALLVNVSIGKQASTALKNGPSAVPPIHVSSSVGESSTIPVTPEQPQEKHLPRLSFSKLSRSFRLQNSPPTSKP
ncbi:predicted protein [Naegleria gruberi]|uniref:Predicted protein n=1 Tax=Naegleria gruberi TaxID=5762 RepID=D2VAF7_NAEGR|nr:uncharacterized protein NAEGRDRAFT_47955 [Naegleria gruberi]EFC46421.1 predicted protein [Naegleria gruberi]|eukprot:XP_002679165.1 predicted protein [Naegleria gruberi strain NEG-M]